MGWFCCLNCFLTVRIREGFPSPPHTLKVSLTIWFMCSGPGGSEDRESRRLLKTPANLFSDTLVIFLRVVYPKFSPLAPDMTFAAEALIFLLCCQYMQNRPELVRTAPDHVGEKNPLFRSVWKMEAIISPKFHFLHDPLNKPQLPLHGTAHNAELLERTRSTHRTNASSLLAGK